MRILAAMIAIPLAASAADPAVPVVHPDRTVTFSIQAGDAKSVSVQCEAFGSKPLEKGQDMWSFTSQPLAPDVYSYSFTVDGKHVTDPANPDRKEGAFGNESLISVAGGGKEAPWESRDEVPRGQIHRHAYRSNIASHDRELFVYTPPGYSAKTEKPLPVLYLLHGFSDLANAWSTIGRAPVILDNLIADGKVTPMIVVMPLGYGDMSVVANGWEGRNKDGAWQKNLTAFDRTLIEEVIPLAESNYKIRKDRDGRAVAGLSMGGSESLQAGLLHPDTFGWVGAFSSGGMPADLDAAYPEAGKTPFKLFWVACGREDGLIGANRSLHAWLEKKQVKHSWTETDGAHRWGVWRRNLAAFTPLLFKEG
ncbi:MAG: alpha/beta hydrolase-fold protein [Luteolibacter sp.]